MPKDLPNISGSMLGLEWAFAGISTTTRSSDPDIPPHTVWAHWMDSKSGTPAVDEGDMYPQPNGDVLEKGSMVDPTTGLISEYEELWADLEINIIGAEEKRVCIVLKAEPENKLNKGMVIRNGGWCQGILQSGEDITVERWQWVDKAISRGKGDYATQQEDALAEEEKEGNWERVMRLGSAFLPCGVTFETDLVRNDGTVVFGNLEWKVAENYRW